MQPELPKNTLPDEAATRPRSMPPCLNGLQIILLAAIRVIDPAVQHELAGAPFDLGQRHFPAATVIVEFPEADSIQIPEKD